MIAGMCKRSSLVQWQNRFSDRVHPSFFSSFILGVVLFFGSLSSSSSVPGAHAETALKSGIRGRVVVAREFLAKKTWPVQGARTKSSLGVSRVRRPVGCGPLDVSVEASPELLVVLEGVKDEAPKTKKVVFEGLRFTPGTLLLAGSTSLQVANKHLSSITLRDNQSRVLGVVAAGETKTIQLKNGKILLSAKEFPFAMAEINVVEKAKVLSLRTKDGFFDDVPLEPGDYRLAFYHGATPFIVQEITVPAREYIAIDATISGNRVATISIKDGGMQAVKAPKPPPAPSNAPKMIVEKSKPASPPKKSIENVEEVDPGDIE